MISRDIIPCGPGKGVVWRSDPKLLLALWVYGIGQGVLERVAR